MSRLMAGAYACSKYAFTLWTCSPFNDILEVSVPRTLVLGLGVLSLVHVSAGRLDSLSAYLPCLQALGAWVQVWPCTSKAHALGFEV